MNLETEDKINLIVNFIQRCVKRSKLSLIFTKTLYFHIKHPIFRITHALKNEDDSKLHITNLNLWKLTFRKQPIIAEDEIKVSVILANKYKVKAKNFIIPIFYFPVSFLLYIVCCNNSNFSFFILISFLFEDLFKASKEQVTINEWYKNLYINLRRCSAASNSKRQVELRCNSIFSQTELSQLH